VRCSGSRLRSSRRSGVLRSGRADVRCSGVRSGVRSSGLLRSRRSGVLRSGSCGLLRSFELLRLVPQGMRQRHVRLVQEAVPSESRLRTFVLLRVCSQLLRSGPDVRRSVRSDLRCSVRCLQLM
jgi:hypothetical protein